MTTLFERIADVENIRTAYEVLRDRYYDPDTRRYIFRPGPDGAGFDQFESDLSLNLRQVKKRLMRKDFAFGPYFERPFPRKRDSHWLIGQFNLRDRITYRAIYQVVAPEYDNIFSDSLVSYRKRRGSWDAVLKAMRTIRYENGGCWVFRTDVHQYVERMDHQILERQLRQLFIYEPTILKFFLAFIVQPRIVNGVPKSRDRGVHPGAELTTFLYNLYLNDLDHYMVMKGFRYSRYSDDMVVFARSQAEAVQAKQTITRHIKRLKLELHAAKTLIAAPQEPFEYLGYGFRGLRFTISKRSVRRMTRWIRRRLPRDLCLRLGIRELGKEEKIRSIISDFQSPQNIRKLTSWLGYFQRINDPSQLKAVDSVIRERIAVCLTQRLSKRNYKHLPPRRLEELGLYSLVGLYYRLNQGRPLPRDVQQKLGGKILFSPKI